MKNAECRMQKVFWNVCATICAVLAIINAAECDAEGSLLGVLLFRDFLWLGRRVSV